MDFKGSPSAGLPVYRVYEHVARGALIADAYLGRACREAVGSQGKQAVTSAGPGEIGAEFGDAVCMMDTDEGVAAAIGIRYDHDANLVATCGREFGHEARFGRTARSLVVVMVTGAEETSVGRALLPRAGLLRVVIVDRDSWYGADSFAITMPLRLFL